MCLCFFHISLSYLSYSCVFVSFCLLCVALSLLSEPPHTVAKSWLRTGGFLLSHFVWAVAQREIVKGLARMGTGLAGEQSRGQAETRIWSHTRSSSSPCDGGPWSGPYFPSSSPVMEAGRRLVLINLGVKNQSLLVITEVRDSVKASGWKSHNRRTADSGTGVHTSARMLEPKELEVVSLH